MAGPVVVLEIVSHRLDPSVIPRNQGNPSAHPRILGPSKGPPLTVIPAKAGISRGIVARKRHRRDAGNCADG